MHGRLEVICGPMFSGKTEELIRRVRRAAIARLGVQVFVPTFDTRNGVGRVVSHAETDLEKYAIAALPISTIAGLASRVRTNVHVVALDEVQFMGAGELAETFISEIRLLLARKVRVIVAGLDRDYRDDPFGHMPALLSNADEVLKLTSVCSVCKQDNAVHSQRISGDIKDVMLVGAWERYEARCRTCYVRP